MCHSEQRVVCMGGLCKTPGDNIEFNVYNNDDWPQLFRCLFVIFSSSAFFAEIMYLLSVKVWLQNIDVPMLVTYLQYCTIEITSLYKTENLFIIKVN